MGVNARYKDSVFSFLFSNPETLRELYSAIEGIPLNPQASITVNTLSDVLYMEQYNDISFTIDDKLVILIEHQSTINPNMPLRLLLYIARIYEKIIERKNLYRERLLKIPRPEFIVLYNGLRPYPDRKILKLSEAFQAAGLKAGDISPELELAVRVYNINKGHNEEILRKSGSLRGYSTFVDKIRENRATMPLDEAMKAAIEYCRERDILGTFLVERSSEVFNMLLTEWNIDEAKEVWREEAMMEGMEQGMEQGIEKGMEQGIEKGMEQGIEKGIEQGIEKGIEQGIEKGREEGREEGREDKAIEIAKKLLARGLPPDTVSEATGLELERVKKLAARPRA